MVAYATLSNISIISWRSVLLVKETLSHNVASGTSPNHRDLNSQLQFTDCIGSCKSHQLTMTATTVSILFFIDTGQFALSDAINQDVCCCAKTGRVCEMYCYQQIVVFELMFVFTAVFVFLIFEVFFHLLGFFSVFFIYYFCFFICFAPFYTHNLQKKRYYFVKNKIKQKKKKRERRIKKPFPANYLLIQQTSVKMYS